MEGLQTLKDKAETCAFCKLKEINELKYGPLYKRDGLVAHYYCVLFSYRVIQNGADDEGILGFLTRDIRSELKRVRNVICDYCLKPNASVYCCNSHCNRKFHFPCGILRKSLHQYKGSFKSFCSEHRPRQKIPLECLTEAQKNKPKCVVCYDDLDYTCETDVLWANCCLKTWYHRDCLQKFALSSGYLFKCAICNNRRQFKQWVEEYGIFVPKQDASWELEPNAFSELLVQHGKCDAVDCICPFGREFSSDRHLSEWELILCKSCGSQGIHPACSTNTANSNWECDLCKLVRVKLRYRRSRQRSSGRSQPNNSNRSRSYLMSGNEDRNVATSSISRNIISLQTVTSEGRIIRSRTERKRKRTEVQDEKSDLKKTAFDDGQSQDQGSQTCFEKASTTGHAHSSTALPNFHAYDADTDDEAVDIEEISPDTSEEDEEIIVDGPEISYVGTSNNDIEESKRRDQGILIIDLTESTCVDNEEIVAVMETYRSIQLSDVRYRVKKEVYVISDDDDCKDDDDDDGKDDYDGDKDDSKSDDGDVKSVDNDLEIILHKNNSHDSRKSSISSSENDTNSSLAGVSRNSSKSDSSLIVQIEDDPANEENSQKMEATPFEDRFVKDKEEREVEVLEISDEAASTREVKPRSSLETENSQGGSSSHATSPSDKKRKSDLLDKYFFILLKEKTDENHTGRLTKDSKKVIVNHSKRCGNKSYKSFKMKESEEDGDSPITLSSDSETENSCKKEEIVDDYDDDDDDDDDVQIINQQD